MCIAICSLKGNDIPSKTYLENSFDFNPDGAGFAFNISGKVEIHKGYMTFDSFYKDLMKYDKVYNLKNRGVLIHCRIATHGKISVGCCHPFPISNNLKELSKGYCLTDYAVIHNGIIDLCKKDTSEKKSDTMEFIMNYISPIASNAGWFKNKQNMKLIERLSDSKIAILNNSGEIIMTSGFHRGEDGNYYSNDSYEDYSSYYKPYYGSCSYGEYGVYEKIVSSEIAKSKSVIKVPMSPDDIEYFKLLAIDARYYGISYDDLVGMINDGFTIDEIEEFIYDYDYGARGMKDSDEFSDAEELVDKSTAQK